MKPSTRSSSLRAALLSAVAAIAACSADPAPSTDDDRDDSTGDGSFTAFETGQVRPIALSADGNNLFVTNTPAGRLQIYRAGDRQLTALGSVFVGLEPVAVAARNNSEVWVVNHLSDSVSIVDVTDPAAPLVVRTLLVGDEPRDIVFAGPGRSRAFITTAHRGQNTGRDPQLTTPGVGRADVWVFDAGALGSSLAGDPLEVLTLFADTPRALAVSPDGATVYAASFHSGNRTTAVGERLVSPNGQLPEPRVNAAEQSQPAAALIVKRRPDPSGQLHWLDDSGRVWDEQVMFDLPDRDVFAIDAMANPPAARPDGVYTGVGTTLFNMAVNPVSGVVYVSNTEARNDVRFEGHNQSGPTHGGSPGSVRGHIAESRITVLGSAGEVSPRHLNKHIDYSRDGTASEAARSLAFPTSVAVSADGERLYVAAFGSSKVGLFRTDELEDDSFAPSEADQIAVTGGGPAGIALDEPRNALYVHTRFDNGVSIVDTETRREIAHVTMPDPEPASITSGRRFLYDATLSSSHGDSACASCHVFGDLDSLAWDLGDPDAIDRPMPGPFAVDPEFIASLGWPAPMFQALKGPMITQSLRGLANHGPMHWRGDRTGGTSVGPGESSQPDTGTFDEAAAFRQFNVAFTGLLGRSDELSAAEMKTFSDFVLQLTYPPNPIRNLDNTLTALQQQGRDIYFQTNPDGTELAVDRVHNCNGCHTLDPDGNAEFNVASPGFFGTDGQYSFPGFPQWVKVPQLRNLYQKVGMFGMRGGLNPEDPMWITYLPPPYNDESPAGEQVRGFGFVHDGTVDTLFRFHSLQGFARVPEMGPFPANPGGFPIITDPTNADQTAAELAQNVAARRAIEAFLFAYDSNLAPVVGQQVTLTRSSGADATARVDLLAARARAAECDLVAHARVGGRVGGLVYSAHSGTFAARDRSMSMSALRELARSSPVTFTAVPPGSGNRIASGN